MRHTDRLNNSQTLLQKGFTLIELLVVISIIGFLVTIVLLALTNARRSARDTTRKQVAAQVRKGLELYYGGNGNGTYYTATTAVGFNDGGLNTALSPYINALPNDQLYNGTLATNYQYQTTAGGTDFAISIPFGNDSGGTTCKFTSPGGTGLFSGTPICSYQK